MFSSTSSYYRVFPETNLHIDETGNPTGPLILLLHGLGGSTETFVPIIPYLDPERNRIVSVDLEGFGKTGLSSPDVKISIPRHVDELESLVVLLQKPLEDDDTAAAENSTQHRILIIGHSLGAIIAMHYAAKRPERIRGLALLGAGRSIAHVPAARERMLSLATKARVEGISAVADVASISNFPAQSAGVATIPDSLRKSVRQAVAQCNAEAYAQTCEAVACLDHLDPDYGLISAPTLLLAGGDDVISPPDRSVGLKGLIGDNAWVVVLEGVGHQMILQDLDGSVKAIRSLLEKVAV